MIVKTPNGSIGIDFNKVSYGDYHSHRIYRNWFGQIKLEINFLERGLRAPTSIVRYKFKFDSYEEALYVINKYLSEK